MKVEHAIERLIDILDDIDGDPDFEPWLGAPEAMFGSSIRRDGVAITHADQGHWGEGCSDDREDHDEDGCDLDRGELDE